MSSSILDVIPHCERPVMPGDLDALRGFVAKAGILSERIRCVPNPTPETVRSIDRGILFVMALWSGPSHRAFAELKGVLERLNVQDKLELVVVDTDGSSALEAIPEMKIFHGAGETFWIREGGIVSMSGPGLNLDRFKPNTIALLSMP